MKKSDKLRLEYIRRINKVMDYINDNLENDLNIEILSQKAFYSQFHFHRIFSALVGETINQYINRKRVECAASCIIKGYDYTIQEISEKYGFKSPSSFSRSFKKHYGYSATEMQNMTSTQYSKICQLESNNGKKVFTVEDYICNIDKLFKEMDMKTNVQVKEMPEMRVAYIRHTGEYSLIGSKFHELFNWISRKNLLNQNTKAIAVYHDDPNITEMKHVRTSACFTVDKEFKEEGEIGSLIIKKGKYAVGRFEIDQSEFKKTWEYMCAWTLDNGYLEGDGDYYEIYCNNHEDHPEKKFIVDICIPVK